jgi:prepilin-type N-terminal cleavage/methylation domain-containing protein
MFTKSRRSGFTLPEILVTVTVIAVLAAVVVPAVTQYANKGDAPSAKSDVLQISGAITGFASDVRYYPGSLAQLTSVITTSQTDASGAHTYSASDVNKWKGPYTPATLNASGYAMIAGYQVQVGPTLSIASAWLQAPIALIAGAAPACSSVLQLDTAIDGTANSGAEATTGQIQWTGTCTAALSTGTVLTSFVRLIPAP